MSAGGDFPNGVAGSRVSMYAEMCRTGNSDRRSIVSVRESAVCPGIPSITSTEMLPNPALCADSISSTACAALWSLPSFLSSPSWSDCTPTEMRFTPAFRSIPSVSAVVEAGLHSAETSAPGAASTAAIISAMCGASRFGVPPPKYTVPNGSGYLRRFRTTAAA